MKTESAAPTKSGLIKGFIRAHAWLFFFALLALIISSLLSVILPLSLGWFYETVLKESGVKSRLLKFLPIHVLDQHGFFLVFGLLLLLKAISMFLGKFLIGVLGEMFSRDIREMAFEKQMQHTMASHQMRPVGKYLLRYSGDLLAIQNLMSKGALVFIGDVIFLMMTLTVLYFINSYLLFSVSLILGFSSVIMYALGSYLRHVAWERRGQRSKNLGFVSSRLQAFYTIKSFNRETPENNSFINRSRKLYHIGIRFMAISSLYRTLPVFFFFMTLGWVLYQVLGLRAVSPVQISKGDVLGFLLLLLYMQGSLKRILSVNIIWQVGIISFDKLLTLMSLPSETRNETADGREIEGNVIFREVSFSYAPDKKVFENLSFQLLTNSLTLITGAKGSGKTTLLKLIQKIYRPLGGQIYFGDQSYDDLSAFEIRKQIAIVSADTPLLGGTVFKAVSYNTSDEKRQKTKDLLRSLNIRLDPDEDANLLFKLEEGGRNISAGERIMLQFARAFLTRKKVLLIDDVFAYLDSDSQKLIFEKISKLRQKRTIVIISQNPPEQLSPDQIIQL